MAVEMLGNTLATQIVSAIANVADSMKEMTAAFEKQRRCPHVYSSSALQALCVISLEAGDVDKFDVAAQQLAGMTVPPQSSSPTLPIGTPVVYFLINPTCPSMEEILAYLTHPYQTVSADSGCFGAFHIVPHGKPHAATKDTMARWVKGNMFLSGVDTNVFHPHSCHSASSCIVLHSHILWGAITQDITFWPAGHGINLLQISPAPDCLEGYHN